MRRLQEFDALRGIAALVIVLAHLGHAVDSPWVTRTVDLFFLLSGYFITSNILKSAGSSGFLRVFFLRRTLRIWPAYYAALVLCLLLSPLLKWDQPNVAWPYYLTFTQNVPEYWGAAMPPFSGMFKHTWTLAIEEQFYILWPLLAVAAGRKRLIPLAVLFMAAPLAMRSMGFTPYLLLTRCDGLALGALLAALVFDRERLQRRLAAFRTGFALVGVAALSAPVWLRFILDPIAQTWPVALRPNLLESVTTLRCCVAFFALAGLVLCYEGYRGLGFLRERRLCRVGRISYGLYLYHPFVFAMMPALYRRYVFQKLGLRSTLLMDVAMVAVCFLLAELSRLCVEEPFMALKQRLSYDAVTSVSNIRVDSQQAASVPHRPDRIETLDHQPIR